jgi:pilus assembly protein CpaE
MPNPSESEKILLLSNDPSIIEATRASFEKDESLHLVTREVTSEDLFPVIDETQPYVILLDFNFSIYPFDLIDNLASRYPKSAVVAILPEVEMGNSDRVILSGARAFIQYPYRSDILVTTTKRVMELMERNQAISSAPPKVDADINPRNTFTVFSPKGGVGTTLIATNLAISLHKTLKQDVLLIDGKHLFGHVALFLNLRTGNSITDLISHAGMLDQRLIKQVVVKHNSGIQVLPSPNGITEAQGIRPENLFTVLQSLQQVFPYIIIDGGNNLNDNTVTYMDSSDKILLVFNSDISSMRDVRQFMDISTSLSYPKEKILLILNLTGRKADVKREEIENILKMKIFGKIPTDENMALSSVNEGVPLMLKKPFHPISRAISDITKELLKLIHTPIAEDTDKVKVGKTGFLKRSSKQG